MDNTIPEEVVQTTTSILPSVNDEKWMILLTHFIENPLTLTLLAFLIWIGYLTYKDRLYLFTNLFKSSAKQQRKKITKQELLNHILFVDLDFWAVHRIPQLYDTDNTSGLDEAKLHIAKDLLIAKFAEARKFLFDLVSNTDFDAIDNLSVFITKNLEKLRCLHYAAYKKLNIPSRFLEKWYAVGKIRDSYLQDAIHDLAVTDLLLTNYDKMHMVLNNLNVYYDASLHDMKRVIQSINGDLKGEVYANIVIGGNDYKRYPVPNRRFIPIVEDKLLDLIQLIDAERASICVFHDMLGDDYIGGCISKIYSVALNGKTHIFNNTQYATCTLLENIISDLKQHEHVIKNSEEFDSVIRKHLKEINTELLIIAPMFVVSKLKGILVVGYEDFNKFKKLDETTIVKYVTNTASILNTYIDYRHEGLNYANNQEH